MCCCVVGWDIKQDFPPGQIPASLCFDMLCSGRAGVQRTTVETPVNCKTYQTMWILKDVLWTTTATSLPIPDSNELEWRSIFIVYKGKTDS